MRVLSRSTSLSVLTCGSHPAFIHHARKGPLQFARCSGAWNNDQALSGLFHEPEPTERFALKSAVEREVGVNRGYLNGSI